METTINIEGVVITLTKDQLTQIVQQRKANINYQDIKSYSSACKVLEVNEAIKIEVEGFDEQETNVVKAIIKKMRVCKVLNKGHRFKRGDNRWYSWYNISSGFVFGSAAYDSSGAGTCSASRLCFLDEKVAKHFSDHFKGIDEEIIDL